MGIIKVEFNDNEIKVMQSMLMIAGAQKPEVDVEPLSDMSVGLSARTVTEIVLIALLLASIAGVASVIKITRYEPVKILTERN